MIDPSLTPKKPTTTRSISSKKIIPGLILTLTNDVVDDRTSMLIWDTHNNSVLRMINKPQAHLRPEIKHLQYNWVRHSMPAGLYNIDNHMYLCFDIDPKFKFPKSMKPKEFEVERNADATRDDYFEVFACGNKTALRSLDTVIGKNIRLRDINTEYSAQENSIVIALRSTANGNPYLMFSKYENKASFDYSITLDFTKDRLNAHDFDTSEVMIVRSCKETADTYFEFFKSLEERLSIELEESVCRRARPSKAKPKTAQTNMLDTIQGENNEHIRT